MRRLTVLLAAVLLLLFAGCNARGGSEDPALPEDPQPTAMMYATVNENKLEIKLADNLAVDALVLRLQEGDITFTASENGGFELYGSIGDPLPKNDENITAKAGDVLLYAGRYLCFFYGGNSYAYTRIGTVNDRTMSEVKSLLSAIRGSVQVTLSLK